jgi:hypothetical protein
VGRDRPRLPMLESLSSLVLCLAHPPPPLDDGTASDNVGGGNVEYVDPGISVD